MSGRKYEDKCLCPICGQTDFRVEIGDDMCPVCRWWFEDYDTWKEFTYHGDVEWIREERRKYNYYDNLKKQGVEYNAKKDTNG